MDSEFGESYTEYQSNRSAFRRFVRKLYLRSALSQVTGPSLDFGCGVGELLARLPPGSKGVEYNRASVEYCRGKGLAVEWYDGTVDDWQLSTLPANWCFDTLIVSHVLEHLDEPMAVLSKLLAAAGSRGAHTALVIVPGRGGFRIDPTHRTFIDLDMITASHLGGGWHVVSAQHFPGNVRLIGDYLPHHELQVLLKRTAESVEPGGM